MEIGRGHSMGLIFDIIIVLAVATASLFSLTSETEQELPIFFINNKKAKAKETS